VVLPALVLNYFGQGALILGDRSAIENPFFRDRRRAYKFVSFTPGVELVVEAFEGYWRKTPSIRRIVMRSIPDESTRLAALKRGEVDGIYWVSGELAEELQRTPGLAA
jgi:hypothetical protein